jgi:hypothetical protein
VFQQLTQPLQSLKEKTTGTKLLIRAKLQKNIEFYANTQALIFNKLRGIFSTLNKG